MQSLDAAMDSDDLEDDEYDAQAAEVLHSGPGPEDQDVDDEHKGPIVSAGKLSIITTHVSFAINGTRHRISETSQEGQKEVGEGYSFRY